MSVRERRDIVRYQGHDYNPDHNFDQSLDFEQHRAAAEREHRITASDIRAYARELKTRHRRMMNSEALRLWLEAEITSAGFTFDDVLATVKRGRLSVAERPLYDALAAGVARLRQKGATLEAIGGVIGKGPETVARLGARGDELLNPPEPEQNHKPCRRHEQFKLDCPACLKMACS
jgi:hypothetical protein